MATEKNATLRALVEGVLTELMVKTNVQNVWVNGTTTLAAKLQEVITALNGKATPDDIPTIDVSKSGGVTTITVTDKSGSETVTIQDGTSGGSSTEEIAVPSHWQSALDTGVAAINTAVEAAGRNKSAFLWYTDAHWGYGSGMSPVLLKYLQEHTAVNKINYGGDFCNDYEWPVIERDESYWLDQMRNYRIAVRGLKNHHSVIGNHDSNGTNGDIPYLTGNTKHLYGFVMAPEETPDIVRGGDFYYYIDDPNENTRYLYLNTGFCYYEGNMFEVGQGAFVVDALSSAPAGWHIVAVSHIWYMYGPESYDVADGYLPAYCGSLLSLFDKYNARSSGSLTIGKETVSFNFTDKSGKVEFCIGGHLHVDHNFTSSGGIPVILTRTDSYHWRDGSINLNADVGTTAEAAVNGIVADYDNNKVSIIRIGKGSSRTVSLNGEVSPDVGGGSDTPDVGDGGSTNVNNALTEAGYQKDKRYSTSQKQDVDAPGVYLTGYIPVTHESTIRFENILIPQNHTGAYENHIYGFDSSKGYIGSNPIPEVVSGGGKWNAVWEDGYLSEITYGFESGFVRFNATKIDSTSVITVIHKNA